MWSGHLEKLNFINEQLRSPVAVNILMNLEEANSSYGQSFHLIKKELTKVLDSSLIFKVAPTS